MSYLTVIRSHDRKVAINYYYVLLLSATTIHSILLVQITCFAIFLHKFSMSSLVYLLVWSPPDQEIYSIYFFTKSVSSFRSTCPYHRNLFCCSINIISSIPSLSLNSLLGTLFYLNITYPSDHSHLCSLKCHLIFFPDRPGLTSM